jgi:hypothetical protein
MAVENSRLGGHRGFAFGRAAALQPFNATNCTLAWVLLGNGDQSVLSLDANVAIKNSDPSNGGIQINLPSAYTALAPGRYTDVLQVRAGASTALFWIGQIQWRPTRSTY